MELGHSPALELGSGPALVHGCKRYLECSPALEHGCKRRPPHGHHFKPDAWHKNNKALIKAEDLKGSSDTRRVNSSDLLRDPQDRRWEDLLNQFSRPTTEDEEQFGRIEEHPQLEDRFRGLLTVSWTRGYSPHRLPTRWIGPRTPMAVHSWATSGSPCRIQGVFHKTW
mgnify:CR=1 FL=1